MGGPLNAGSNTIYFTPQSTTGDGTTTINWMQGNKYNFQFGAQNESFAFSDPSGSTNLLIKLTQDGVGSRTASWPSGVSWVNGIAPTLSSSSSGVDIVSFYFDGTNYYGGTLANLEENCCTSGLTLEVSGSTLIGTVITADGNTFTDSVALPAAANSYAGLEMSTPQTEAIDTNWEQFIDFDTALEANGDVSDIANDEIDITTTGLYLVNTSCSFTIDSAAKTLVWGVSVNGGVPFQNRQGRATSSTTIDYNNISMTLLIRVVGGQTLTIRMKEEGGSSTVTFSQATLHALRIAN